MLLIPLVYAITFHQTPSPFEFDVRNGLKITVMGIPVVSGAGIQYYEDGWTKGYYSSNFDRTPAKQIDADTYEDSFSGAGGLANGLVRYRLQGNHLQVHYDLHWSGDKPVKIELTEGLISAQVMQAGALTIDGKATRSLVATKYIPFPDLRERVYGPDGSDFAFDAPLVKLGIKTSVPTTLFDARGYDQDYAIGKSLFWLGELGLDVSKEKPVVFDVDWEIQPKPVSAPKSGQLKLTSTPAPGVIMPDERPPLIIPKPTTNQLKFDKPLVLNGNYDFPAGHVRFWEEEFLGELRHRFEMPNALKGGAPIHVDGGVSKLGFHPGGYQITITNTSISVFGEEDEGLHNALRKLAEIAIPHGGKVALPTGYLSGNPALGWRGVHLFVGPDSRGFQKKLWERVLLPLGFNKVVLQCERTEWDCMPNLHGVPGFMTKPELAGLFQDYRAIGVEPIPLIQSFGHMEWFFEGKQNLDLAVNPDIPYTIDPRKPKSKELISAIWDEACDLLRPTTIHFGCDEVDMLGFPNDSASLTSDLWQRQMPVLKGIADQHGAQMMLWGDMALAPGEAIDAENGVSVAEATKRRAVIPKGARIADWHYKPEPKIEAFLPSLQLWKASGFKPIASAWYRPENVRSFDLAADVEKCGTLQTTWCGYFSNEQSMIENMEQFSAMVLAGDFSWSTRYDALTNLGYDPSDVFRRMYFRQPKPIIPVSGTQAYSGDAKRELVDADMHFKLGDPVAFRSVLSAPDGFASADISVVGKGRHIALVLDAIDKCEEGEILARLNVELSSGKTIGQQSIQYGRHVRTSDDVGPMPFADRIDGLSVFEFELSAASEVRSLHLETVSARGGLRLHGLIIW